MTGSDSIPLHQRQVAWANTPRASARTPPVEPGKSAAAQRTAPSSPPYVIQPRTNGLQRREPDRSKSRFAPAAGGGKSSVTPPGTRTQGLAPDPWLAEFAVRVPEGDRPADRPARMGWTPRSPSMLHLAGT